CVAVPVALTGGRVVASVAVQAPVARMTVASALRHVAALRRAADALATTMEDANGARAQQRARK
ncbi:MAG: IclR family transcriptional regulator, partial [Casimicrobiaceae bacterium]